MDYGLAQVEGSAVASQEERASTGQVHLVAGHVVVEDAAANYALVDAGESFAHRELVR